MNLSFKLKWSTFGDRSEKNTMSNAWSWKGLVNKNFVFTSLLLHKWHELSYHSTITPASREIPDTKESFLSFLQAKNIMNGDITHMTRTQNILCQSPICALGTECDSIHKTNNVVNKRPIQFFHLCKLLFLLIIRESNFGKWVRSKFSRHQLFCGWPWHLDVVRSMGGKRVQWRCQNTLLLKPVTWMNKEVSLCSSRCCQDAWCGWSNADWKR